MSSTASPSSIGQEIPRAQPSPKEKLSSRGFRSLAFTPSLVDRENSRSNRDEAIKTILDDMPETGK